MNKKNIAGMSLGGGRRDKFFFCVLEYFYDSKRWFLTSFRQVKDEEDMTGDEAIPSWLESDEIEDLILDFPLTSPPCQTCELPCPGLNACIHPHVQLIQSKMHKLLEEDQEHHNENPKDYERKRLKDNEYDHQKNILAKDAHEHLLSKSFKRKLKKGFIPYWNRPLDYWVWNHYYDQLLEIFKISYDSYGDTSLMLKSRFSYMRRHFPPSLTLHESNTSLCLLELLRAKIVSKNNLLDLQDLAAGASARLAIIENIEKSLGIFIYEHDLDLMIKNPKAFDSFLLALTGTRLLEDKIKPLPSWSYGEDAKFVVPSFV